MRLPRIFTVTIAFSIAFMTFGPIAGALTVPPGGSFFDDDDSVFEADIEAIAAEGVTKGCNAERTSFCPTKPVTRGQMAAFLVRALKLTAQDPAIDFTDDNDSIFENDIEKLATAGITKGCNPPANTSFCPTSNVTRGQMAAFLTRAIPYERPIVAPRPATTNGPLLDTFSPFDAKTGWCDGSDREVCRTSVSLNQGEFHLFEYWFADGWSTLPTALKEAFLSDKVRVEAYLNGGRLSLVETTDLEDDTMFKDFTFQFPAWLTGTHTVTVLYINRSDNYQSSIVVTLNITALSSAPLGAGGEPSPTRSAGRIAFPER